MEAAAGHRPGAAPPSDRDKCEFAVAIRADRPRSDRVPSSIPPAGGCDRFRTRCRSWLSIRSSLVFGVTCCLTGGGLGGGLLSAGRRVPRFSDRHEPELQLVFESLTMHSSSSFGTLVRTSQPSRCHEHVIFDPHTAPAGQINARFDRHNHPRGKRPVLVGGQSRQLMHRQTDAVTERMVKLLTKAGLCDRSARRGIDLFHDRTGANRRDGGPLRGEHNSMHTLKLGRKFTCQQYAGQVAVIKPAASAPIDQHKVEVANSRILRRPAVWQRGPRTDAHDRRKRPASSAAPDGFGIPTRRRSPSPSCPAAIRDRMRQTPAGQSSIASRISAISPSSLISRSDSTRPDVLARRLDFSDSWQLFVKADRHESASIPSDGKPSFASTSAEKSGSLRAGLAHGQFQTGALLGKLLRIAAVGDQQFAVGRNQQIARIAR